MIKHAKTFKTKLVFTFPVLCVLLLSIPTQSQNTGQPKHRKTG